MKKLRKAVVFGFRGMLGSDVMREFEKENIESLGYDIKECDITVFDDVYRVVKSVKPDIVVNCAAFTNVDLCEDRFFDAYRVNVLGQQNISIATAFMEIPVIYISSDYVFDGNQKTPYIEHDPPNPINRYGKTKLFGEVVTRDHNFRHFIVRTGELFGYEGKNFVKTVIDLAKKGKNLKIVNDQWVSPTFTKDLARQIVVLARTDYFGTYHATSEGMCNWYEFALLFLKEVSLLDSIEVTPVSSEEYGARAKRPSFSVLENLNLKIRGLNVMPHYKEGLKKFLNGFKS